MAASTWKAAWKDAANPFIQLINTVTHDDNTPNVPFFQSEQVKEATFQSENGCESVFRGILYRLEHGTPCVQHKCLFLIRVLMLEGPATFNAKISSNMGKINSLANQEVRRNTLEESVKQFAQAIQQAVNGDSKALTRVGSQGTAPTAEQQKVAYKSDFQLQQEREMKAFKKRQQERSGGEIVLCEKLMEQFDSTLPPHRFVAAALNSAKKKFQPEECEAFAAAAKETSSVVDVCSALDAALRDATPLAVRFKGLLLVDALADSATPEAFNYFKAHTTGIQRHLTTVTHDNAAKAQAAQQLAQTILNRLQSHPPMTIQPTLPSSPTPAQPPAPQGQPTGPTAARGTAPRPAPTYGPTSTATPLPTHSYQSAQPIGYATSGAPPQMWQPPPSNYGSVAPQQPAATNFEDLFGGMTMTTRAPQPSQQQQQSRVANETGAWRTTQPAPAPTGSAGGWGAWGAETQTNPTQRSFQPQPQPQQQPQAQPSPIAAQPAPYQQPPQAHANGSNSNGAFDAQLAAFQANMNMMMQMMHQQQAQPAPHPAPLESEAYHPPQRHAPQAAWGSSVVEPPEVPQFTAADPSSLMGSEPDFAHPVHHPHSTSTHFQPPQQQLPSASAPPPAPPPPPVVPTAPPPPPAAPAGGGAVNAELMLQLQKQIEETSKALQQQQQMLLLLMQQSQGAAK